MATPTSESASTSKTFTELNRDWFDTVVAINAFQIPWIKDLGKLIASNLRDNFDWFGVSQHDGGVRLLDYACGNGLCSMAFSPFIAQAMGIDLSDKMVEAYNKLSQEHHLSEKMHAVQGDLLSSSPTLDSFQDPEFFNFDVITMSMALHHVMDTQLMINKLHERLRDGGVLIIVDWLKMDLGDNHGHGKADGAGDGQKDKVILAAGHTVAHLGFNEEVMKALFENAGMVDIGFMEGIEKSKVPAEMGGEQQVFIAKARKVGGQ